MANLSRRFPAGAPPLLRFCSAAAAPLQQSDPLHRRLSDLRRTCTSGMVASTIDAYISEGRAVSLPELEACIRDFRRFNQSHLALEVMEWMELRKLNFEQRDYAIYVDLIAKVKGIAAAEDYFNRLPPTARAHGSYAALLNCYCKKKMTEKALALFSEMSEKRMISKSLSFNELMPLLVASGQPEKVVMLAQEMMWWRIRPDAITYNLLMNSYADLNDIKGAERVFERMKQDSSKNCDYTSYSNLARIYIKAGYWEKAKEALQSVEKEMETGPCDREAAFQFLISSYASLSDLDQVHRVWRCLRSTSRVVTSRSYLVFLQALGDLGDMKGMSHFYKKWESRCAFYDVDVANAVIRAYLRHGKPWKAESVLDYATRRSRGPFFCAREQLVIFYLDANQIKRALEIMELAAREARGARWKPGAHTVDKFLRCFERESDVGHTEEFYELMKRMDCVDGRLYVSLLGIYEATGETALDMRERIERDGVEISSEMEHLLASVCR